jgi:putative glutamine amidotransferase
MPVLIALPEPTSSDSEYNGRALPQYVEALKAAGATSLVVPLGQPQALVAKMISTVQGILLPGSRFDVDPERYGERPIPACGQADAARTAVDELLLQDAFNLKKPILAICHGMQTLNVWRNGALIQDLRTSVNHRPGREVVEAHPAQIAKGSRLAALVPSKEDGRVQVNSSHHQAIRLPGDRLTVSAISPGDGVIEAVELDSSEHFVLAVQWHPERTLHTSGLSRAIFAAFVESAKAWQPPKIGESGWVQVQST